MKQANRMTAIQIIVIAVALIVALAVVIVRQQRTKQLRGRVGPSTNEQSRRSLAKAERSRS